MAGLPRPAHLLRPLATIAKGRPPVTHPSTLHIDLDALSANHRVVSQALAADRAAVASDRAGLRHPAGSGVCAVLKADGYSLGAARLAKKLASLGLDLIAVYHPDEARELLNTHLGVPVLIFMPVHALARDDRLFHALSRGLIHLSIHDRSCFDAAADIADSLGISIPVHIAVDTGMARAGSPPDEAYELINLVLDHPRLRLAGLATHFASADSSDELTRNQLAAFDDLLGRFVLPPRLSRAGGVESRRVLPADLRIHAANSFAFFRTTAAHFTTVRVGIALLGYAGEEFADPQNFALRDAAERLTPILRWSSSIVQIKVLPPGATVGYGSTWRAPDAGARIGTLPVGYADGYPVALSSDAVTGAPRAHVTLTTAAGERVAVPVLGRVSMDQITVDLSRLPDGAVHRGHAVDVVSNDPTEPNHLPKLARAAGSMTHEMLCRLSARLDRRYVAGAQRAEPAASTRPATVAVHGPSERPMKRHENLTAQ